MPVEKNPTSHPLDGKYANGDVSEKFEEICVEKCDDDVESLRKLPCTPQKKIPYVKTPDSSSSEEENSHYEASLASNLTKVTCTRENARTKLEGKKIVIPVDSMSSDEEQVIQSPCIPELTPEEEYSEARSWRSCRVSDVKRTIDMKVIEPYKRILSHGGYLGQGSRNAVITFSACYLPSKGRVDYSYVMDNLFLYVLSTLNELITDDYVLIYLQGGTPKDCMPTFLWLKDCYQMIDRKLKKNLKALYLVHPTFWLKAIVTAIKPFISSKFGKKLHFVNTLRELNEVVELQEEAIPDIVRQYDRKKSSLPPKNKNDE